jgi:hypothetical protein
MTATDILLHGSLVVFDVAQESAANLQAIAQLKVDHSDDVR